MKRYFALFAAALTMGAQGATVTYDFNADTNAAVSGSLSAGAVLFTHGTNSEENSGRIAERAWFDQDESGDALFFISARSSDNKGIVSTNLDMTAGAPSYVSFRLTPDSGTVLDFSDASLDFDAVLFQDNTSSFTLAYQVWADSGSGWEEVSALKTASASGSGSGTLYEADEETALSPGSTMIAGTIGATVTPLSFDLSGLLTLTTNQEVTLAVALSGNRDAQYNFGSALDDLVLSIGAAVETNYSPEARADAYSMTRGGELAVAEPGVLMNDTDEEGDAFSALLVTNAPAGSLTFSTNGSFEYVPPVGYTGTVEFAYAPVDAASTGAVVSVSIQVLEPIAVERPNILIFFADDMGIGDSRIYNTSSDLPPSMPTVEAFAASGMVFSDSHTQAALCAPSRYSILTGNYPWRGRLEGGSWHMNKGAQVMPGQQTLAHVLNEVGYHTAIFGKGHLGGYLTDTNGVADTEQIVWNLQDARDYLAGDLGLQTNYYDPAKTDWSLPVSNGVHSALVGFDYSYMLYGGIQDPLYAYFENDLFVGDPADLYVFDNPNTNTANGVHWTYRPGYGLPGWYTCDVGPTLTQKTMDFIDQHVATNLVNGTDEPFFIHYCAQAVHSKHTPPTNFLGTAVAGTTGLGDHADMLFELEVAFSNILERLEHHGLLDDTLVIFTSDNGGLGLYEAGSTHNPNEGLRGYKASIWEGGHRVPLFIKWGDRIPAGSYGHMVGVHDLYATIAQLVGNAQGEEQGLDAVSFLPVLLGGGTAPVRDNLLMRGNSINKNTQDVDPEAFLGRALREGTYKLIWDRDENVPLFLYDLSVDPEETVDLLNEPGQAARVARMSAAMTNYVSLIEDYSHPSEAPRSEVLPAYRDLNENGMDDDWEEEYFGSTNAVDGGAYDDFDGDSIENIYEFLFGTDPAVMNDPAAVLPGFSISGNTFEYVYRRRQDAAARGHEYIPQQSGILFSNDWDAAGITEVSSAFIDADTEAVTNQFSMEGTTNRFFRLEVNCQ